MTIILFLIRFATGNLQHLFRMFSFWGLEKSSLLFCFLMVVLPGISQNLCSFIQNLSRELYFDIFRELVNGENFSQAASSHIFRNLETRLCDFFVNFQNHGCLLTFQLGSYMKASFSDSLPSDYYNFITRLL